VVSHPFYLAVMNIQKLGTDLKGQMRLLREGLRQVSECLKKASGDQKRSREGVLAQEDVRTEQLRSVAKRVPQEVDANVDVDMETLHKAWRQVDDAILILTSAMDTLTCVETQTILDGVGNGDSLTEKFSSCPCWTVPAWRVL